MDRILHDTHALSEQNTMNTCTMPLETALHNVLQKTAQSSGTVHNIIIALFSTILNSIVITQVLTTMLNSITFMAVM